MAFQGIGAGKRVQLAPEFSSLAYEYRGVLAAAGIFSGLINLLALSSSIYMLQVYDRVIPSHSVATLVGLSIGMLLLFAGYGILDVIRTRLMSRIAIGVDRRLRERVMALVRLLPLRAGGSADAMQPVRDLDQIRSFTSSGAPVALFDMPWMPFYLALVWLLHPWLGILATLGGLVLVGVTIVTDVRGREPTRDMAASAARRMQIADTQRRNAGAIRAMGMGERLSARWSAANESFLADQTAATDVIGTYGAVSKVLRLVLQSAVLGLGAYLVIDGQATGGVMIASSILVSRALAPIEIAIANWRGFIGARQSFFRLSALLKAEPVKDAPLPLPPPKSQLDVEGLWVAPPGSKTMAVSNASFSLKAGAGLGVIGPSASGKSSLARALLGVWPAARGTVRLDGAALDQWAPDDLGQHIGFLPQDLELLDGTVAENIARFEPDAPAEAVIDAARKAGVHDMIVHLADGYDTKVGEAGAVLSAGQRQRVALARALYRDPFLVVLDEPNSNLDKEGDDALEQAMTGVRARGGIVVVVAHRPSALAAVDHILVMSPGQQPAFGPKDEIYKKLGVASPGAAGRPAPPSAPAAGPPVNGAAGGEVKSGVLLPPAPSGSQEASGRLRIITDGA